MIRILVVDDSEAVRVSLSELLSNYGDLSLVGAVPDGETAVAVAADSQADVVLMDINMPGMGGVEATRRIMRARPQARILMFSAFSDREHLADALAAGAVGLVAKGSDPAELMRRIREAASVH